MRPHKLINCSVRSWISPNKWLCDLKFFLERGKSSRNDRPLFTAITIAFKRPRQLITWKRINVLKRSMHSTATYVPNLYRISNTCSYFQCWRGWRLGRNRYSNAEQRDNISSGRLAALHRVQF